MGHEFISGTAQNDALRGSAELSRRSVVQAAAWTIPVVAAAATAPLASASGCSGVDPNVELRWMQSGLTYREENYDATPFVRSASFPPVNATMPSLGNVGLSVAHSFAGGIWSYDEWNGNVKPDFYQIGQTSPRLPLNSSMQQTVVFTFSEPLYNLRFAIGDLDRVWNSTQQAYVDHLVLTSSSAFTSTKPTGSLVQGSGTAASPWMPTTDSIDGVGNLGRVDVVFPGPVTSFTITYRNAGYLNNPTAGIPRSSQQVVTLSTFVAERRCPAQ